MPKCHVAFAPETIFQMFCAWCFFGPFVFFGVLFLCVIVWCVCFLCFWCFLGSLFWCLSFFWNYFLGKFAQSLVFWSSRSSGACSFGVRLSPLSLEPPWSSTHLRSQAATSTRAPVLRHPAPSSLVEDTSL